MYDVITIGSATVDIFMKSTQFHLQPTAAGVLLCEQYGDKIDIDDFEMQSGGAGTNTAVGFSRLGFRTAAVVEVGEDFFAQMVVDDLQRDHVVTDFIVSTKQKNTALSVLLIAEEGGRSALTHRGAASLLEARDLPWQALHETRWVHLSNIGGNKELLVRLFDHLRHNDIGLSWNPGQKELVLLSEKKLRVNAVTCDIFILNKEEWAEVANVQTEILRQVPYVVVTDGRNGGYVYFHGQYQFRYTIPSVQTVQETGAGDAFSVGFVAAHLMGRKPSECAELGVKNAAHVVQFMGAKTGLLTRTTFEQ